VKEGADSESLKRTESRVRRRTFKDTTRSMAKEKGQRRGATRGEQKRPDSGLRERRGTRDRGKRKEKKGKARKRNPPLATYQEGRALRKINTQKKTPRGKKVLVLSLHTSNLQPCRGEIGHGKSSSHFPEKESRIDQKIRKPRAGSLWSFAFWSRAVNKNSETGEAETSREGKDATISILPPIKKENARGGRKTGQNDHHLKNLM